MNCKTIYNFLDKYLLEKIKSVLNRPGSLRLKEKFFRLYFRVEPEVVVHSKPQLRKIICVFSHFDKNNKVQEYVRYYLKKLYEAGCDIVFVTTSEIDSVEQRKISKYCCKIIIRQNIGIDFYSYKVGIQHIVNISECEKIILANDSVYGPFYQLTELINYGDSRGLDIWGATDSNELSYHVQSYFLVYSKKVIQSKYFQEFWNLVKVCRNKFSVIFEYEVGGSQFFIGKKFKLGALCSVNEIAKEKHVSEVLKKWPNMTLSLWDYLIVECKYPFIKRMLLTINPCGKSIGKWDKLIEKSTGYDTSLIAKSLNEIQTIE